MRNAGAVLMGNGGACISSNCLRFSGALASVCASILVDVPVGALAADKDVVELQRDVAIVGDQVNTLQTALNSLQSTVNQKLGALREPCCSRPSIGEPEPH